MPLTVNKPDLTQAQASVQAASARAGAYLSSWGSWAAEKRKKGWAPASRAGSITEEDENARPAVTTVSELARDQGFGVASELDPAQVERMRAENARNAARSAEESSAEEKGAWAERAVA